jgi:hypothetical protein
MQTLKTGTRIELYGTPAMGGFPGVAPEAAKIARWTAVSGPIKNHVSPTNGGWHIVEYSTGGKLCVHESGFRVIDNRAEG